MVAQASCKLSYPHGHAALVPAAPVVELIRGTRLSQRALGTRLSQRALALQVARTNWPSAEAWQAWLHRIRRQARVSLWKADVVCTVLGRHPAELFGDDYLERAPACPGLLAIDEPEAPRAPWIAEAERWAREAGVYEQATPMRAPVAPAHRPRPRRAHRRERGWRARLPAEPIADAIARLPEFYGLTISVVAQHLAAPLHELGIIEDWLELLVALRGRELELIHRDDARAICGVLELAMADLYGEGCRARS